MDIPYSRTLRKVPMSIGPCLGAMSIDEDRCSAYIRYLRGIEHIEGRIGPRIGFKGYVERAGPQNEEESRK